MFGRGYIIDYIILQIKKEREEMAFKVYVTDTLKMINDKITSYYGGSTFDKRFYDIVEKKQKKDIRTGEQIANDVIRFSGLKFDDEGGEDNGESSI